MSSLKISTTAVEPEETPFLPGRTATAVINSGSTAVDIKGSDDGSTYTTLASGTASELVLTDVVIPKYLKTSSGTAYLIGGA